MCAETVGFYGTTHRERTETVTETVTDTGCCGVIHRDRYDYRSRLGVNPVSRTVSVDHPIKTNSLCSGLCDGLCTVSVDCTIKANSLCAQKLHGRSCCVSGCRDLFVVIDGLAPTSLQKNSL